jgi:hypothetical protein
MRPVVSPTGSGSVDFTMCFDQGESAGLSPEEGQRGQGHRNLPANVPGSLLPLAEGEAPVQTDQEQDYNNRQLRAEMERRNMRARSMDDWSGSHRPEPQRGVLSGRGDLDKEPEPLDADSQHLSNVLTDEDVDQLERIIHDRRRRRARDQSPPPQHLVETTDITPVHAPSGPVPFSGHRPGGGLSMDSARSQDLRSFAQRFPEAARLRPNDPSLT